MIDGIYSDEPTLSDSLGRVELAKTFAALALSCETPLVVGVYGAWGAGKTTFLKLIEDHLDTERARPVWFNAWEHESDEAPAVSLLHATVEALDLGKDLQFSLAQVALAFGSVLLQKTTTLSIENLEKVKSLLDEEAFRVREARTRLREHFNEVIRSALNGDGDRIVFFFDDLDRCSADSVLRMLSAIKLYFNLDACVFFLGVDRETLEAAVGAEARDDTQSRYLDKLIQLPFFIPPIAEETFVRYLKELLPEELESCVPVIKAGLEPNPRTAKRFVNNLLLRHSLAKTLRMSRYDPRLLALLLLIEEYQLRLYRQLSRDVGLLRSMNRNVELAETHIDSARIREAVTSSYVPQFSPLTDYFSLTNLDIITAEEPLSDEALDAALQAHRAWTRSFKEAGARAEFVGANLSGADLTGREVREGNFATADLSGANLSDADLRRAVFSGASLANANLTGAMLTQADLREADLTGADLRRADLRDADLTHADLRHARLGAATGLDPEQLAQSLLDEETELPSILWMPFRTGEPSSLQENR